MNFRFESLDIWKESIDLTNILFDIADLAEEKKKYKFAEQLNGAALSISNNIAEGSGSYSNKDFANFLNISRRSIFECANILHVYEKRRIITEDQRLNLNDKLLELSKKIHFFRKSLIN
ncbi:four helix bundle protein [Cecembia lonarensis]|nr:four helix bundle protein [Cecembia lonarensis]